MLFIVNSIQSYKYVNNILLGKVNFTSRILAIISHFVDKYYPENHYAHHSNTTPWTKVVREFIYLSFIVNGKAFTVHGVVEENVLGANDSGWIVLIHWSPMHRYTLCKNKIVNESLHSVSLRVSNSMIYSDFDFVTW